MPCSYIQFADASPYSGGLYLCHCPGGNGAPMAPSLNELRSFCLRDRACKTCPRFREAVRALQTASTQEGDRYLQEAG